MLTEVRHEGSATDTDVPGGSAVGGRDADYTLNLSRLPEGVDMVMPGDNARIEVSLDRPIALEAGSRFAIREGGKTVGSGVVSEVLE